MENKLLEKIENTECPTVEDFFTSEEAPLMEKLATLTPELNLSNIRFIRATLKKTKRSITEAELKVCEDILAKRRRQAGEALIASVDTDCLAVKKTFDDLKKKASALYGKHKQSFSFEEAAAVSYDYMKAVGITDETAVVSTTSATSQSALTVFGSASALSILDEDVPKVGDIKTPINTYVALLRPKKGTAEAYNENIKKFFVECLRYSLHRGRVKVNEFGLLGTLSKITTGAKIDLSKLTRDKELQVKAMTSGFIGKSLVTFDQKKLDKINYLADKLDLHVTIFAKCEDSGVISAISGNNTVLQLPVSFILSLTQTHKQMSARIEGVDLSEFADHASPVVKKNGKAIRLTDGDIILDNNKAVSVKYFQGNKNCFVNANNAFIDAALELMAYGINRRAIRSAIEYELPAEQISDTEIGEDTALILGTYRAAMELAIPTSYSNVRYTDNKRGILCTAYAMPSKYTVGRCFKEEDHKVCFLGVTNDYDGFIDYKDLRRVCDYFFDLCKRGIVVSARPVTGKATDALDKMCGTLGYKLYPDNDYFYKLNYHGFVFEVIDSYKLHDIGDIVKTDGDIEQN